MKSHMEIENVEEFSVKKGFMSIRLMCTYLVTGPGVRAEDDGRERPISGRCAVIFKNRLGFLPAPKKGGRVVMGAKVKGPMLASELMRIAGLGFSESIFSGNRVPAVVSQYVGAKIIGPPPGKRTPKPAQTPSPSVWEEVKKRAGRSFGR